MTPVDSPAFELLPEDEVVVTAMTALLEQEEDDSPIIDKDTGFPDNLVELEALSEETLLEAVAGRFKANVMYTYVSDILLAVNPYKNLGLYLKKFKERYDPSLPAMPIPHIYAIAQAASKNLRLMGKSQVCLISGESGAGKTETAKQFMNHLLNFSGNVGSQSALERKIMESQPLLEAFGNAKTGLNDNSSRFGKFMEVIYSAAGDVTGARIQKYLLEKTRVVGQARGETNYHIFFYLTNGSPQELRDECEILPAQQYRFLSAPETGTDDEANYSELIGTMTVLGFEEKEIDDMQKILSAILLSGNLDFVEEDGATDDASNFSNPELAAQVASVLMVDVESIRDAFTMKHIVTAGETFHKPLDAQNSREARDTFAQNAYDNLFSWLAQKLNGFLSGSLSAGAADSGCERVAGVLDIFGFENFDVNSFEQLCINCANEQLQYFFNQHIFKWEIDEMKKEGIRGPQIEYTDNADQLSIMLARQTGIFSVMDEQAKVPKANDQTCIIKLHRALGAKEFYEDFHEDSTRFQVTHYAGAVIYRIEGFMLKNRNSPSLAITSMMQDSELALAKEIFASAETTADRKGFAKRGGISKGQTFKQRASRFFGRAKSRKSGKASSGGTRTRKAKLGTLGAEFRASLEDLMLKLERATPHFVRCIKPNLAKAPGQFQREMVAQQLKYTGVMETTKIRSEGYPLRLKFQDFIDRYRDVAFPTGAKIRADPSSCRKILDAAGCRGWQRGKTKLFLKAPHIKALVVALDKKKAEDEARLAVIEEARLKREREEQAFEERRQKQVDEIRKAAEAQPSSVDDQSAATLLRVAEAAKKKKPKKLAPSAIFETSDQPAEASKIPPPVKARRSRRGTGLKGKKFTVRMCGCNFLFVSAFLSFLSELERSQRAQSLKLPSHTSARAHTHARAHARTHAPNSGDFLVCVRC
jgi:myosin-3